MTVVASTFSLLTEIILVIVSSDTVNAACKSASREYQLHHGNKTEFFPSPIQDHVFKDTIYTMRKASSDVVCAVHCLQDDSCKSFNYCNDKKLCHLKTANYSVKGSEKQAFAGCRHYGDVDFQVQGKKFNVTKQKLWQIHTSFKQNIVHKLTINLYHCSVDCSTCHHTADYMP